MFRIRVMRVFVVATLFSLTACADGPEPLGPEESMTPRMSQSGRKIDVREFGGPPYYASLGSDLIVTDGDWVAIVFFRSPDCIPEAFNLLNWLDFSLFGPGGAACPLVAGLSGFAIFGDPSDLENGIPPRQEHYMGDAVPVWFAPLTEFEAAIEDGVLTIEELAALDGLLMGVAHNYNDSIRNSDSVTGGKGNRPGSSTVTAKGTLEDGRSFHYHLAEKFVPPDTRVILNVKITIR